MSVFLLVLGIVLFILLIIVHEMGHFITARRNGVVAEEFGIFFPPRLWSKRMKGGWVLSINLLPLGGFVKMKGEHDSDTAKGSFGAASLWAKSKIMAAGVVVNIVVAYLLFVALAWLGMPQLVDNQFTVKSDTHYIQHASVSVTIGQLEKNSPASSAGLKVDDQLVAIGPAGHEQKITGASSLTSATQKYQGQTIEVTYKRGTKTVTTHAHLRSDAQVAAAKAKGQQIGHLGVGPNELRDGVTLTRSTWSAPIVAGGIMGQYTALTFQGLGKAVSGLGGIIAGFFTHNHVAREAAQTQASDQVSGPVGIYFVLKLGSTLGYRFVLFIIAIVSMTLGIMNILPIPALDGGRLWITLISRAVKRPLSAKTEELVTATGFLILLGLIILVTVVDIRRFF